MRTVRVRVRLTLLLALVAGIVIAPGAVANPSCPLLVDPAGDAQNQSKPIADDPSLDYVSADMVADSARLAVVMRVVQLSPSTSTPSGASYDFGFVLHDATYVLRASYRAVAGVQFALRTETVTPLPFGPTLYQWTTTSAKVDGTFDEDTSEIRMSVALKDFPSRVVRGQRATKFRLVSWLESDDVFGASADFILAPRQFYVLGRPGCIPVPT